MGNTLATDGDFIKYFGNTYQWFVTDFKKSDKLKFKRDHFHKIVTDQQNSYQLKEYYCSDGFIFEQVSRFVNDLDFYRDEIAKKQMATQTAGIFYRKKDISILDHGCGNAEIGISHLLMGYENVTFMDFPHSMFKFLQEVIPRHFPTAKFIEIDDEKNLGSERYDYIISNEVLEHCVEPVNVLGALIYKLKAGRVMWLSTFFDDCNGQDPSHLALNTKNHNHCQTWHKTVVKCGLVPIAYNEGESLKVWYKPYPPSDGTFSLDKFIDEHT